MPAIQKPENVEKSELVASPESSAPNFIKRERLNTHTIYNFKNCNLGKGIPPELRGADPPYVRERDPI